MLMRGVVLVLVVSLISFVGANKLLCLTNGQSVPSEENKRYTCWHDVCQVCVSDNNFPGVDPKSCTEACVPFGNVEFDVTPPEIVVNSPVEGGLYSSRRVLFDVDSNEPFSLYYIDNVNGRGLKRLGANLESYSRAISLKDGFNSVTILARDRNNNPVNVTRTFIVDSKKPKISKVEPSRGVASGLFSLDFVEENPSKIVVRFEEVGSGSLLYSQDLSLGDCSVNVKDARKRHCEFDLREEMDEFDGREISYSFSVEDVVGNVYVKSVKKIVVDTSAPVLNNPNSFWTQGVGRYARYVYFSLNISEENLDEATYSYIDSRGREKVGRICSRLKDGVCEAKKSFRNGDYLVSVNILDDAGWSVVYPVGLDVSY